MRLACISNASYLQLIFNLQLKNEHVRGVGLEKLSLGTFFMDFFVSTFLYCEHIKACSKNIIFNKLRILLSFSVKKTSGRWILNQESWKCVFVIGNLFSINSCFFFFHFDYLCRKCKKY